MQVAVKVGGSLTPQGSGSQEIDGKRTRRAHTHPFAVQIVVCLLLSQAR